MMHEERGLSRPEVVRIVKDWFMKVDCSKPSKDKRPQDLGLGLRGGQDEPND